MESSWRRTGEIIEQEAAQTEALLESKDSERPTYISVNVTSFTVSFNQVEERGGGSVAPPQLGPLQSPGESRKLPEARKARAALTTMFRVLVTVGFMSELCLGPRWFTIIRRAFCVCGR